MGKKRNKQADPTDDVNNDSTESGEDVNTGGKCEHIQKGLNLSLLRSVLKKGKLTNACNACKDLPEANTTNDDGEVFIPTLWMCLQCGHQSCGGDHKKHNYQHYITPHSDLHCLCIDTHKWSIWCYKCEKPINTNCTRRLMEAVDLIKKSVVSSQSIDYSSSPVKPEVPHQKSLIPNNEEKQTVLSDLPKVGGLVNLGNTCFFNAVLQCLAQTPFLVKVLDDLKEPGEKFVLPGGKLKCNKDSEEEVELPPIEGSLSGWGDFTQTLHKTLTEMQTSNGQTIRPSKLLDSFKKGSLQCMDGGQHDSHELLRHLLEHVRTDDLKRYQKVILEQCDLADKSKRQSIKDSDGVKAKLKFYSQQASSRLLGPEPVFRGVLVSTLECQECKHSSQRTEPFLDLSLPVMADKLQPPFVKKKNNSLEESFDISGCSVPSGPSKYQLKKEKKEKKAARKNRKNRKQQSLNNSDSLPNENSIVEENNENLGESEESDADVEDNIEAEGVALPEVVESGYSSEKASAVASPVSPGQDRSTNNVDDDLNLNSPNLNHTLPALSNNFLLQGPTDNSTVASVHQRNNDVNDISPSPTDVSMTDLTEVKPNGEADNNENILSIESNGLNLPSLLLPSSAIVNNSDMTSPEGPTLSPLSSSVTYSKDSPQSPVSSTVEIADIDKNSRYYYINELIKSHTDNKSTVELEENDVESEISNQTSLQNGIGEIASGISRLNVSSHQSPTRYATKEGECSIQSCLNQFTALELMTGSNKVGCEACTAREKKGKENGSVKMVCTPSTKQYLISRIPAVLILHLKRFQAQRAGYRKVNKNVLFPRVLDLAPICKGRNKTPKLYALYGVVEHSGTLHGGHYVAYVKSRAPLKPDDPRWAFLPAKDTKDVEETQLSSNKATADLESEEASAPPTAKPPPGRWYNISDSRVSEVDESVVLQSQAYLLFYERIL